MDDGLKVTDMHSLTELYHIRIMAGDTVLPRVLYDTPTPKTLPRRSLLP